MSISIPPDFQRGLVYTVHPRILAPLVPGEEYRILASTRIRLARNAPLPSYEPLYRRARLLTRRRAEELTGQDASGRPHTWVKSYGWFRMDISDSTTLAGAVVVLGAACAAAPPPGKEEPSADALCLPYTSEMAEVRSLRDGTWDEFYNDFDMRSSVDEPAVLTVSYGEYVSTREGVDVDALTARALQRARSYFDLTEPGVDMTFVRREWACLETGRAARPLLAHVTLYFDPPSDA